MCLKKKKKKNLCRPRQNRKIDFENRNPIISQWKKQLYIFSRIEITIKCEIR